VSFADYWFLSLLLAAPAAAQAPKAIEFSVGNMDLKTDPCVDFYQYACGGWMVNNPIPPDQSVWVNFDALQERNRAILQNILEKSSSTQSQRDADTQKIGDFYHACMDQTEIDKQGIKPLDGLLNDIRSAGDKKALLMVSARLGVDGVPAFFGFGVGPDAKDSQINIAQVGQGGFSLPDRDYYLKMDAKYVGIRKQYLAHVRTILQLGGATPAQASAGAQVVLKIETELAKAAMDRVSLRDPNATYHKMTVQALTGLAPVIDWPQYFTLSGAPSLDSLNVSEPAYFRELEKTVANNSLDDLKTYVRWQLLHHEADLLPASFQTETFGFFGKVLTGALEQRPRWKRCVDLVDGDLGFALGRKYVDETFGAEGKQRTLRMVGEIEKALRTDIDHLDWMTPATKKAAAVKLAAVANKIGYPDKWRDYSSVRIERVDAAGDDLRATEFEARRIARQIGKPVDRKEWYMTPPTVNAYYNPQENNINFPAGILQPPFFDTKMDDAVNYGAVGMVVGHELTHGFDDQGRQFDAEGNLKDWWTPEDAKEFEKRAQCFIDEYSSFVATGTVHLNGKLTLGENTADNGGMRLAFMALMDSLKDKPQPKIDGFTPEQRFFLGFGQIWCSNQRPEASALRATVDPHSPGRYRVNGVVGNMPEFQKAFACKVTQPMVRHPACRVW
jgi:putative endopeptidase